MGNISRRSLLRTGGALVVSFGAPLVTPIAASAQTQPDGAPGPTEVGGFKAEPGQNAKARR